LEEIFLTRYNKTDYDLLAYVWEKWRDVSGRRVREKFTKYAELTNMGAVANSGYIHSSYINFLLCRYSDQ
jgi:hypothetical protein